VDSSTALGRASYPTTNNKLDDFCLKSSSSQNRGTSPRELSLPLTHTTLSRFVSLPHTPSYTLTDPSLHSQNHPVSFPRPLSLRFPSQPPSRSHDLFGLVFLARGAGDESTRVIRVVGRVGRYRRRSSRRRTPSLSCSSRRSSFRSLSSPQPTNSTTKATMASAQQKFDYYISQVDKEVRPAFLPLSLPSLVSRSPPVPSVST
jgi:hypothetical protein